MTPTELDLARRLVASERWRWTAGMRIISLDLEGHTYRVDDGDEPDRYGVNVPDLADPATQGCLLAMLMGASHSVHVELYDWRYESVSGRSIDHGLYYGTGGRKGTYGEKLARALLAAWGAEDAEAGRCT